EPADSGHAGHPDPGDGERQCAPCADLAGETPAFAPADDRRSVEIGRRTLNVPEHGAKFCVVRHQPIPFKEFWPVNASRSWPSARESLPSPSLRYRFTAPALIPRVSAMSATVRSS